MIADAAALILAGGAARRMGGVQKAFLTINGRTLLDRQLAILSPLFADIAISANDQAPFVDRGLPLLADRVGAGPLAGVEAGLAWCPKQWLFVIACDLPFVNASVVLDLAGQRSQASIVMACADQTVQPLLGFYSQICLPTVKTRLAAGAFRVLDLLNEPELTVYQHQLQAEQAKALRNWNRPEDVPAV